MKPKRWNICSDDEKDSQKRAMFHLLEQTFKTSAGSNEFGDYLIIEDPNVYCYTVDSSHLQEYGEQAVLNHAKACADIVPGAWIIRQDYDNGNLFALKVLFRVSKGFEDWTSSSVLYRLNTTDFERVHLYWDTSRWFYDNFNPSVVPVALDKVLWDSICQTVNSESFKKEAFPAEYLESIKAE